MSGDIYELKGNTVLYEVLGVPTTASDKDIRRAYYRIAVLYHPDKNPDGEEIFKELSFAYNILSDPEQKRKYDNGTLKNDLQQRAKEYDPAMDPTVELKEEDLRKFVDMLRTQHEAKREQLSQFELRREEEMKRRAEYDARKPEFKEEYERLRQQRRAGAVSQQAERAALRNGLPRNELVVSTGLNFRTSAEMVAHLQEEDRRRLMGERLSSPTRRASGLPNIKQKMMADYRAGEGKESGSRALTKTRQGDEDVPDFVRQHQQVTTYSANVDETVQKYKNFDYLDVVVNEKEDREAMDGAILSDALSLYDKRN